jgi:F-type H+-transporting ATPase subunit b
METFLASSGLLEDLGINLRVLGTQVVIFVATFIILARILFSRVLVHVTRREEEIRKAREAGERARAEAERLAKDYEDRLARIDKEAYDRMQASLREAIAASSAEVARAQAVAREEVQRSHAAILAEKREALEGLHAEIERLTLALTEKVLETRLDPAVHGPVVRRYLSGRA